MPSTTTIPGANPIGKRLRRFCRPAGGECRCWIGIVPLPIFMVLLALIAGFAATGSVPSDILMAIVPLSMAASPAPNWASVSIIRNIGAAAIFATFIPSSSLSIICCLSGPELDHAIPRTELSVPVYLHHRRQHPGHGSRRLIKGFLRSSCCCLGSVVGSVVGTLVGVPLSWRLPYVLLHRRADHGRRRR
jgi:Na+/citrate or Na+/malate symporter